MRFNKLPKMSDAVFYQVRINSRRYKRTMLDEINRLAKLNRLTIWGKNYIAGIKKNKEKKQ